MQTFLLSTDIRQSAKWLDSVRLDSQVNEALVVLRTLTGWYEARGKKGWPHHTVTQMWRGYEPALFEYILIHLDECGLRDISVDTISERTERAMDALSEKVSLYFDWENESYYIFPQWLTEEFASNHRSILLGKAWESFLTIQEQKYELNKSYLLVINDRGKTKRKLEKARAQLNWYRQWDWTEQPAKRVIRNGKLVWPYLWPEKED